MGDRLATYDLAKVLCVVGGYNISGYGEDGGLAFEEAADIGEETVGADGHTVFSRNNNDNVYVDVTVLETSRGYRDLATLMQLQQLQITILPLFFSMTDPNTGDFCQSLYAVFKTRPGQSKGRRAGERVFRLLLVHPKRLFGVANTV